MQCSNLKFWIYKKLQKIFQKIMSSKWDNFAIKHPQICSKHLGTEIFDIFTKNEHKKPWQIEKLKFFDSFH